eukprot:14041692-Heterocapsa_arctica.AAC.1
MTRPGGYLSCLPCVVELVVEDSRLPPYFDVQRSRLATGGILQPVTPCSAGPLENSTMSSTRSPANSPAGRVRVDSPRLRWSCAIPGRNDAERDFS